MSKTAEGGRVETGGVTSSPLAQAGQTGVGKPTNTRWLTYDANGILLVAGLLFAIVYALFWPVTYTTMDEAGYVGNAYVMRHGTLYADQAGVFVATNFPVEGHQVPKYPLGMAALIALVSFAGWKFALGVNLLVHLLTFVVFIRLLRRIGLPGVFGLLYLLHPTATLYSRTAMADPFSGLLITLAFYAFVKRQFVGAGLLAGVSVAVRTGNIIALPAFALGALLDGRREQNEKLPTWIERLRPAVLFSIACVPGLIAAAFYLLVLTKGQAANSTGTFALRYFTDMFPAYAASLLVLYPGMLAAPLLYRGPNRATLMMLCYGVVLLYSFWFYRDIGANVAESLVVGQRYMLAVLPLFLLAYADVLWWCVKRFTSAKSALVVAAIAGGLAAATLFTGGVLVHRKHAAFLANLAQVRDQVYAVSKPGDRVYCNLNVAKLLHPAWGVRDVVVVHDPAKDAEDARRFSKQSSPKRVLLAYWARAGRAAEVEDAKRVAEMGRLLDADPVGSTATSGTMDGLNLFALAPGASGGKGQ